VKLTKPYYFGCHKEVGHALYDVDMNRNGIDLSREVVHYLHKFDSLFCPQHTEENGIAEIHHLFGKFTVLAFWDNSIDSRPGSNSQFFLPNILSFDTALFQAMQSFNEVFMRFTFPVQESK